MEKGTILGSDIAFSVLLFLSTLYVIHICTYVKHTHGLSYHSRKEQSSTISE